MSSILRGNDNPPDMTPIGGWSLLGFVVSLIVVLTLIWWANEAMKHG